VNVCQTKECRVLSKCPYLIDPLARAIYDTPPHFADSLRTAAKCLLTEMGARKDFIEWLWPRVELLASAPVRAWRGDGCDGV